MLGVRTTQVFTSKWKALLWSAGVLLTAYCSIPSADESNAAKPAVPGQPSEQEIQAREILRNLDGLKSN
jgi:hypothetical protein